MEELGLDVAQQLVGESAGRAAAIQLLAGLDSVSGFSHSFSSIMSRFIDDLHGQAAGEGESDWLRVQELVFEGETEKASIRDLMLTARREAVDIPVPRTATADHEIALNHADGVFSVKKGQKLLWDVCFPP